MFDVNLKKDFTVDIVIPIKDRSEYDVLQRLRVRDYYNMPSNFNIFVVDYGCHPDISQEIQQICTVRGYRYEYVDARYELFNLSRARNVAILKSQADYLIYEDVDLISHRDFYQWINQQIQSMLIDRNWPFLVIPVAYLSEKFSVECYAEIGDVVYDEIVSEIFNPDSLRIDFYAAASSHIVCSRKLSKLIGGFDESFEGWGFEDSDFELRFLRKLNIEKPRDFYKLDTRPYTNQTQWSGWRTLFRIFADIMAQKGIYSFHLWHPKPEHRSDSIRKKNHEIFKQNSNRYANTKWEISPLHNVEEATDLFLNENPHFWNLSVFHFFDNPFLVHENDININMIPDLIKKYSVRSVVVNNPYGKEKRKIICDEFKKFGIPVYIVERGALPGSVYIDKGGFCAESNSYKEENWIKNVNSDNLEKVYEYINEYKSNDMALEPQSELIGGENFRYKTLGASAINSKILFIALQSPSDTTTNFFCGSIESYDKYIQEMQKLCYLLEGTNWKVIYKNHPLTIDKVQFESAICVDEYHINDILDACDAVSLINSGVGVLSMIYDKPVYYFGQAFYDLQGVNKQTGSAEELFHELINGGFKYDKIKALSFLSFLVNDFYSFASWERKERKHTDKAKMSISENIVFQVVRVDGKEIYFNNDEIINLRGSILFDRYRTEDCIFRNGKKQQSSGSNPKNNSILPTDAELAVKKMTAADKLQAQNNVQKKYTIKTKAKKLIKDPNRFFVDFLLKRAKN